MLFILHSIACFVLAFLIGLFVVCIIWEHYHHKAQKRMQEATRGRLIEIIPEDAR